MLKLRGNCNGIQSLHIIPTFRHLLQLYSTSTSPPATNPAFVNYLQECLGFTKQQAVSTSTKLSQVRLNQGAKKVTDFNFLANANSVIMFLRHIGLEHSHIRKTVVSAPKILLSNVDKTLKPKTDVFVKMGFSDHDFSEVVKVNPFIFFAGLDTSIVPAIETLRRILGCDRDVVMFLKKFNGFRLHIVPRILVHNVGLLRSYGIGIELIRKRLLVDPSPFLRRTMFFKDVLIKVEEKLGIPRKSGMFLVGVHLLACLSEKTIESKREIFKSFGWSDEDVVALCRRNPMCFVLSEVRLKQKLDFLMNEMGYEPRVCISHCCLLTCSLEKRIVPRHKVLVILKEKGLMRMDYPLQNAVRMNESQFLEKLVIPYKDVLEVCSKHVGLSLEALTQRSSKKNSDVAL